MNKALGLCAYIAFLFVGGAAMAQAQGFKAPSGNIVCYEAEGAMNCIIFQARWSPEEARGGPGYCDLDSTRVVSLPPSGRARSGWVCHGDVFWPYEAATLGYGSDWRRGAFACSMRKDGVRCSNGSGNGFWMRRANLQLQ